MGRVKKQNRSLVLRYMNSHEGVSRKEIAQATNLTPAAVTQMCNDFLEVGLIKECGVDTASNKAGRRKVRLSINSEYAYILGINIESDKTHVVVSNLAGDVKASMCLDTCEENELDGFLDRIRDALNSEYDKKPHLREKIVGGCVAVAGEVDKDKGVSVHAYGIWENEIPLCDMLEEKLGLKFIIENNIDAFAMAEIVYGTASKYNDILVIKWGPGVGCSIVVDGKIYEGRHGRSAEVGHCIIEQDGIKCSCGRRGCLETKVSFKAMQSKRHFDVSEFGDVYRDYEEEIDIFARTLVNTMSILAPDRVVLAGKLFQDEKVRDVFISDCESYFKKYNKKRILYTPLAKQEDYIGPIAAYIERELY